MSAFLASPIKSKLQLEAEYFRHQLIGLRGLRLSKTNFTKSNNLPQKQIHRLYHLDVLVSTHTGAERRGPHMPPFLTCL